MNGKQLSPLRQKDIRTGAKQERERIIAILEKHGNAECGFGVTHDLIELIKKESN